MIIDCAVYRDGARLADNGADLRAAVEAATGDHDFVWIGLHDPSRQELCDVADIFGLHPLAVEDAVNAHQRPKVEPYGDGWFAVLKTLWYVDETDSVETGEIHIFVGPHYIVTVRHGAGADLTETRRELESRAGELGHGPVAVVYEVCDRVVDEYELVAQELSEDVDEVESSVFSDDRPGNADRIYVLKRELLEFRRAALPLREPLDKLSCGEIAPLPESARLFFRDVHDHLVRVSDQVETLDTLLSGIFAAHSTRVSVQQNNDMRKISAWVAIAAVPTMIAGIYGMNFKYMPELSWRIGYPLVLLVMLAACFGLYRSFKRSGWL